MQLTSAGLIALLIATTTIAGCGDPTDGGPASSDAAEATENAEGASTAELADFCAALDVMGSHDGTTPESEAVAAIEEARAAAPSEIRDDANLLFDTLIVNNYPSSAEPSMTATPPDQLAPSSARMAAFAEQNCGPDG